MTKTAYVIARDLVSNGRRLLEYWTGDGDVSWRSPFPSDAFHFTDAGAAYQCAQTHSQLRDSEEWRVVPADPTRRRRK